jgi:hypothetical protein
MGSPMDPRLVPDEVILDGPRVITNADVISVLQVVDVRLAASEGRLMAFLERIFKERDRRMEVWEGRLEIIEKGLAAHLERAHDDAVAMDARVRPIKTGFRLITANWKTIALVAVFVVTMLVELGVGLAERIHP